MSDGVKFVFKTLFKVPVIILAAYLLMNILGLATTFFRVQGVQYGLENVVTENNYISRADLTKLMPQVWALGYSKDDAGQWRKIAYVDEIGFLVQNESGDEFRVPIPAPNTTGTNASIAAENIITNANMHFADSTNSPLARSQYGRSKVVGCYADYVVLWPLTVYDNSVTGSSFDGNPGQVVQGYDNGNWQESYTTLGEGGIFTGNAPVTGDYATDTRSHANNIIVPLTMRNTVVGIKYYADLYN